MNEIIEIVHQLLGNLVETYTLYKTYVDGANQWIGILAAADFAVRFTKHMTDGKSPAQLVFGREMISQ